MGELDPQEITERVAEAKLFVQTIEELRRGELEFSSDPGQLRQRLV